MLPHNRSSHSHLYQDTPGLQTDRQHWPELPDEDDDLLTLTAAAAGGDAAASSLLDEEVELLLLPTRGTSAASSFQLSSEPAAAPGGSSPAAVLCLYCSHFMARWAWRTWEFAVALILMKLSPSSLLLVSVYGLLDNLTRLLLGPFVGGYIDRTPRLGSAVTCYAIQNICIAASAAAAAVLVALQGHPQITTTVYWLLMSITIIAGASSSVGSLGAAIAVEREYPKVLCGAHTAALSKTNSVMRGIDLSCQMLAPVATGFLMTYVSMLAAVMTLAAYCLAVWLPECLLLQAAHKRSPALRQPKSLQPSLQSAKRMTHPISILLGCSGWATYFRQSTLLPGLALALLYLTVLSLGFLMTSYLVWRGMPESTISLFRAAGALSGLTATLIFHPLQRCAGLTTAGALGIGWQLLCLVVGVTPVALGHLLHSSGSRSSSSDIGSNSSSGRHLHRLLLAAADALSNSSSSSNHTADSSNGGNAAIPAPAPVNAGFAMLGSPHAIAAGLQVVANASEGAGLPAAAAASGAVGDGVVGSSTAHQPPMADSGQLLLLYVLLSGLVASRLGLWLFDLAVLQMQQELVPDQELGTVGGVQSSIQSFFEILSFVAGLIAHKPQQFWGLMLGSCGSVATAAGLYLAFLSRCSSTAAAGLG